jgi:hypothetical protein
MENHENPVIQRQLVWINRMKSQTFNDWLINGDVKPYLILAMAVAHCQKSTSKKTWFDFVDGIIGAFIKRLKPELDVPFQESWELTENGFKVVTSFFSSQDWQKAVIQKHQFRTDIIEIQKGIQTKITSKSLLALNQSINMLLMGKQSVLDLRRKFIKQVQEDYQQFSFQANSSIQNQVGPDPKMKKYKDGADIKKLALLLYYTHPSPNSHDFNSIANNYGFTNGVKLGKIFSIFSPAASNVHDARLRRIGPCKEVNSDIQIKNRIRDFEWVIEKLPEDKKALAEDELKALRIRLIVEE